ncbi:hypothetical protein [Arthrobacter sp. JCM 19049]|uniref:hypothetical protein n=1 Tax=Arthrobacter sp. JCM 19049 TaxID=1460643 RepID=UPI002436BE7A|nr:hypothetical protein [Arthrobacter sp. JCM 19049]
MKLRGKSWSVNPTSIDTAKRRMRLVLILSLAALLAIAGRLFYVQGINAAQVAQTAQDNRMREQVITPTRGSIVDRNGTTLAVSVDRYDLVIDQREQKDMISRKKRDGSNEREKITYEQAAKEIAEILDQDVEQVSDAIRPEDGEKPKGYVVVAKGVTPEIKNEVMEVGVPRLISQLRSERQYPQVSSPDRCWASCATPRTRRPWSAPRALS